MKNSTFDIYYPLLLPSPALESVSDLTPILSPAPEPASVPFVDTPADNNTGVANSMAIDSASVGGTGNP